MNLVNASRPAPPAAAARGTVHQLRRPPLVAAPRPNLMVLMVLMVSALGFGTAPASALQVQDICRLKGSEGMPLVGVGLVVGLSDTGDESFGPSHRALARMIATLQDDTTTALELADVGSVALVALQARIPEAGAATGDRLDLYVEAIGGAESLDGGRLLLAPVKGPLADNPASPAAPGTGVYGFGSGGLFLEDPDDLTSAKVEGGLHVTRDVYPTILNRRGQLELVLDDANASWPVAKNLAALVNGLAPLGQTRQLALAVSPKLVVVDVPAAERLRPAAFISRILESYLHQSQVTSGATVVINERARVIGIDGDVEITPTVIAVKGLTITRLEPEAAIDPLVPIEHRENFVGIDPQQQGGAKLRDLMDALNVLEVPFEDQVNVLKTLHGMGNLHAQLKESP